MFSAAEIAEFRQMAVSMMVDTCTIERAVATEDTDDHGRLIAQTTTVYAGICKVQSGVPQERAPNVGEHTSVVERSSLHLPIDAGPVQIGDIVTITAAAHSPHLPDARYRVAGLNTKSLATAQRIAIDRTVS